jgi:dolichol-phosphate hexosyltransferase
MYKNYKISLVIPCLNEEAGIQEVLQKIPQIIDDVLVIDNGSTDRTVEFAQKLGARIVTEKEKGYGKAYLTGFAYVNSDIIITADGDGSYPVIISPNLVQKLVDEGLDFISACRFPLIDDRSMFRRNQIGNKVFSIFIHMLFSIKLKDALSGMWVFKKDILQYLNIQSRGWSFSPELKIEAFSNHKLKSKEIHIPYATRVGDVKLHPYSDGWKALKFLIKKKSGGHGLIDDRQ